MDARYAPLAGFTLLLFAGCGTPPRDIGPARDLSDGYVITCFPVPGEIAYIGEGVFGMSLIPGANRVDLEAHEQSPDDQLFHEWTLHRDTSFQIPAVCGRHANEYYVCGLSDVSLVLERWELVPWSTGAYFTERESCAEPIGKSVSAAQTFLRYQGPFVDPDLRPAPDMIRTSLTAPALSGQVAEVEVDPENRFLVFRTVDAQGASTLTQYEIANGAVSLLGSPATHPLLSDAACMHFLDSTERGRLLKIERTRLNILYLVDGENDGVFETSLVLKMGQDNDSALPESTLTQYP